MQKPIGLLLVVFISSILTSQKETGINDSQNQPRSLLGYGYDNSRLYNDNILSSFTGP